MTYTPTRHHTHRLLWCRYGVTVMKSPHTLSINCPKPPLHKVYRCAFAFNSTANVRADFIAFCPAKGALADSFAISHSFTLPPIDLNIALRLKAVLAESPKSASRFWLSRQRLYRPSLAYSARFLRGRSLSLRRAVGGLYRR